MSKLQCTPGPWRVNREFQILGSEDRFPAIAQVHPTYAGSQKDNANLIAAALESHAANVAFVEAICAEYEFPQGADDAFIKDTIGTALSGAFMRAQAAIAKATGAA